MHFLFFSLDPSEGSTVVVHTSVPFGIAHLEDTFETVQPIILQHLHNLIPNLPDTQHKKLLRWRYSQVSSPFEGTPGCITLQDEPLMVCAGDAFTGSNFDRCSDSAQAVLDRVSRVISTL